MIRNVSFTDAQWRRIKTEQNQKTRKNCPLEQTKEALMAKNLLPMKPSRVSIKDPESPRMRALNGGSAASGTLYTYHDNFRYV